MNERPIIFCSEMAQAIREGRKTQTRRVVRPQPAAGVRTSVFVTSGLEDGHGSELRCPYGEPGDRLWVRETHTFGETDGESWVEVHYRDETSRRCICDMDAAELAAQWVDEHEAIGDGANNWRPSIHMPRWASRIELELVGIGIQKLSDISHADSKAEGFDSLDGFALHWDRINEKRGYGWHMNPWVWVLEFKYQG